MTAANPSSNNPAPAAEWTLDDLLAAAVAATQEALDAARPAPSAELAQEPTPAPEQAAIVPIVTPPEAAPETAQEPPETPDFADPLPAGGVEDYGYGVAAGVGRTAQRAYPIATRPAAPPREFAAPVQAPRGRPATRARAGLPVTARQWAFISHLRNQLRRAGRRDLAERNIANDRREASRYIDDMQRTLRDRYQATRPAAGASPTICSVCWTDGCSIGPMVPRGR